MYCTRAAKKLFFFLIKPNPPFFFRGGGYWFWLGFILGFIRNWHILQGKLENPNSFVFLAATSSSRNTPWLLLLFLLFFFLLIMMMLPLIINSYNLVSYHQNLMKIVLNWRISHCLSFPGNLSDFFLFFLENLILVHLWTYKKFSPDSSPDSELWSPKSSSFMHGLSWSLLYMTKQRGFHDYHLSGDRFLNIIASGGLHLLGFHWFLLTYDIYY